MDNFPAETSTRVQWVCLAIQSGDRMNNEKIIDKSFKRPYSKDDKT
jgi:hypothetical protein